MSLLNDETLQDVTKMLADMPEAVKVVVFTKPEDCDYCEQIVQLVMEVANTSEHVTMEVFDFTQDTEKATEYKIDKAPAIAIVSAKDYGVRFFGLPSGYEFSTLLHGITTVSKGSADLDAATTAYLSELDQPVQIQVFVTPTCPYCPKSATTAFDMAVASDMVRGEVVESIEFRDLASEYNVMGVPLNVINGTERVEGAAPPTMIVNAIKTSLS
jgi:glutaredoxin-like protein